MNVNNPSMDKLSYEWDFRLIMPDESPAVSFSYAVTPLAALHV